MIGHARRMARPSISARTERPTVTDGLVTVRGRRLRVQVRRPQAPSGPPLLVLNGIGAALDLLDPFVDALPADREVIRLDPPGIGGSPDVLLPYHLTTFAPVVGDLVAQLGHDRVDVLGYSWGGELAQQLAVCRPGAGPPPRARSPRRPGRSRSRRARGCSAGSSCRAGRRTRRPRWPSPPTCTAGRCAPTRNARPPRWRRSPRACAASRRGYAHAARRDRRLDEPARAPPDPGADAGDRG